MSIFSIFSFFFIYVNECFILGQFSNTQKILVLITLTYSFKLIWKTRVSNCFVLRTGFLYLNMFPGEDYVSWPSALLTVRRHNLITGKCKEENQFLYNFKKPVKKIGTAFQYHLVLRHHWLIYQRRGNFTLEINSYDHANKTIVQQQIWTNKNKINNQYTYIFIK